MDTLACEATALAEDDLVDLWLELARDVPLSDSGEATQAVQSVRGHINESPGLPSSWLTRSSRSSALAGEKMKARIKLDVVWIDLSERAAHHHDVPRFPTVLSVGDA